MGVGAEMNNDKTDPSLEAYYVYRSLHSDESWGAVLLISQVSNLPNIDFGITIYATNERSAIARARDMYEKIHKFDTDKENVRRFMASVLNSTTRHFIEKAPHGKFSDGELDALSEMALKIATSSNRKFNEHFKNCNEDEELQAI